MLFRDVHLIDVDAVFKPPLIIRNLQIITAHLSLPHQSILRKRPVFKTVRPPPLARLIVPLVPKLHGNLIICKSEKFLAQSVAVFSLPLLSQELLDGVSTLQELVTVALD